MLLHNSFQKLRGCMSLRLGGVWMRKLSKSLSVKEFRHAHLYFRKVCVVGWAFCLILLGGKIGCIISTFDRLYGVKPLRLTDYRVHHLYG